MRKNNRRGFALPAATGAMVIVGVLVTAGFYMARQELRIGVASSNAAIAVNIAQNGVNWVLINETKALSGLPIWGDTTFVDTLADGFWSVDVTKLSGRLFFLDATAEVTKGGALWAGATRRVGLVTRITSADMEPPAALTTRGSLTIGGASMVSGIDSIPAGWSNLCDSAALGDMPGIMIDDTTNIKTNGNNYEINGTPPFVEDTTITAEDMLTFGDLEWADLVALAEITFSTSLTITQTGADSTLVGGRWLCNSANVQNWGDPLNPLAVCGSYFPIIYAAQNLKINSNGYGQGILLIEEDLAVQGGFTFYGPVIVKGELSTAGSGGHFNGGVIAANVDLGTSTVIGNALVSYSSCAVERAVLNNSALTKVRPLAMRSWVDLTNVVN